MPTGPSTPRKFPPSHQKTAAKEAVILGRPFPLTLVNSLALTSCFLKYHAWFCATVKFGKFESPHDAADAAAASIGLKKIGHSWTTLEPKEVLEHIESRIQYDDTLFYHMDDYISSSYLAKRLVSHAEEGARWLFIFTDRSSSASQSVSKSNFRREWAYLAVGKTWTTLLCFFEQDYAANIGYWNTKFDVFTKFFR